MGPEARPERIEELQEEKSEFRLLGEYLWQYRLVMLLFVLFGGIFALVFSLYDLEPEAVWYALALCALVMLPVLALHYLQYRREHQERRNMLKDIWLMVGELPEPGTLAEADYQDMIRKLKQQADVSITQWQQERQESLDYYTTWVHQIKTPIAVMRMLLQREDTREHRELEAELFRVEQYVEMVLSYMRLGSGGSDFVFQEHELDEIIRQAVHKFAPQFVQKRIRLVYEPVSFRVLTDEKWLLFLLEQVLSNAIKYTPKGMVSITLTPEQVLKIQDTGIGIGAEDVPRIFEKGFTGYNGRADKKSTGLGLYLVKRTSEKLAHRVWVESTPGQGTIFCLDLHREELEVE